MLILSKELITQANFLFSNPLYSLQYDVVYGTLVISNYVFRTYQIAKITFWPPIIFQNHAMLNCSGQNIGIYVFFLR